MSTLYINYRKIVELAVENNKVFVDRKTLPKVGNNIYKYNDNTLLKIFSLNEDRMDERTITELMGLYANNIALPKDVIYTTNNMVAGYSYNILNENKKISRSKMDEVVKNLQALKKDVIVLGEKGISTGKLNKENTKNIQVVDPSGFRKIHNGHNQIVENIDQVNEYYFRNIFNGDGKTMDALMNDYLRHGYNYIGDYLEDTAPKYCTEEEYERNLCKILKIDK